ncbi:pollen-specific leucine-rich repeat extensin-like protein 3 [Maniola jurtina]|uniref:pollen-specific leucine-rich repeat extensin-like protein 3 n=1 Tax=Maniola jurtina TaxID=191418 RepID=UPI001E689ADC|nr:pollen-specific leucine-rich repeat extensin-like protein 3 [Maniola jurtina]
MPPPQSLPCGPYCGNGYCASHCYFKNMPPTPSHEQLWKPPPYSEATSSRDPSTLNRPSGPPGPQHRLPSPGFPHPPMQPPKQRKRCGFSEVRQMQVRNQPPNGDSAPSLHYHPSPPNTDDPYPPVHRPL